MDNVVLRWPPSSCSLVAEIISYDQAEYEPSGSDRALQCAADLRFSDARVVADGDFNNAESRQGAFQDHFNGPAVGCFFERKRSKLICARGAKRAEICNLQAVQD